jgi:hypothetical protein
MQKKLLGIVIALILISLLGFASIALAEESSLEATGTEARRDDALLLYFRDGGTTYPYESGYKSVVNSEARAGAKNLLYNAVLPLCDAEITFGCIKSVEVKKTTEIAWELLTPGDKFFNPPIAGYSPNADGTRRENRWETWTADANIGLPPSGKVQLFDSKLHTHGGGASYIVKALVSGGGDVNESLQMYQFGLSIKPVKVTEYVPQSFANKEVGTVAAYRFPENLEFRFSVKLGALYPQLSGWFFGRITDAQIELDPQEQLLIVSGQPSVTPIHSGYMPIPFPEEFKDDFKGIANPKSTSAEYSASIPSVLEKWLKFEKFLNPKASYESDVWKIDAAPKTFLGGEQDFQKCVGNKPGISGLLTTNATVYLQKPPKWNSTEATLTYQVAGPEFLSDGRTNLGNYLLAMRTDVASCLWKSDLKNAKATVEVTSGDGTAGAQLATTTLSQKNGWIYFSAAGFHFSAPSITVKLTSTNPIVEPTLSSTAVPIAKKVTITCIKGKMSKKVSAVKPVCPKGFKKKS